jgi:hypothetical protein
MSQIKSELWIKNPSQLVSPSGGSLLWPFDETNTYEQRSNALARCIILGSAGFALGMRQTAPLLVGAALLGTQAILEANGSAVGKKQTTTQTALSQKPPIATMPETYSQSYDIDNQGYLPRVDALDQQVSPYPYPPPAENWQPLPYNETDAGPVPIPASVALPYNQNMDETAMDPSTYIPSYDYEQAEVQRALAEGKNSVNPYGNPLPYQEHFAAEGNSYRQPNEMDIHRQVLESAKFDVKKMFGPVGELDEGLFINPLPDPTLMARPVFFPESSEWDRHIVGDFVNPSRQNM